MLEDDEYGDEYRIPIEKRNITKKEQEALDRLNVILKLYEIDGNVSFLFNGLIRKRKPFLLSWFSKSKSGFRHGPEEKRFRRPKDVEQSIQYMIAHNQFN